jgi:hypothetical protein
MRTLEKHRHWDVQGYGHAEFANGTRCALYINSDNEIFATAYFYYIDDYVKQNGSYKLI